MLSFEYPYYLLGLAAVPVFLLGFGFLEYRTKLLRERFVQGHLIDRLIPAFDASKGRLKFGLILAAYVVLVVAIANPRMGSSSQTIKRKGVDIYIALDISKSMWAQDRKPNRMERARQFATDLIEDAKGDRIGLIIFAGQAYPQMPLTVDYSAAQLFLRMADPSLEITQGTAMGEAIEMATQLGADDKKKKQRALVIITDGENHESGVVDAAKEAKLNGLTTFIVGVGTEKGAPIPIKKKGRKGSGFQTDKQGNVVQSSMNTALLKEVVEAGRGGFYTIDESNSAILKQLRVAFDELEQEEFEQQNYEAYDTYYQWLVLLAIIFLITEFFTTYRKKTGL